METPLFGVQTNSCWFIIDTVQYGQIQNKAVQVFWLDKSFL